MLNLDDLSTEVGNFVNHVVPVLQIRGIFHNTFEGKTLRDHAGLPPQHGIHSLIG